MNKKALWSIAVLLLSMGGAGQTQSHKYAQTFTYCRDIEIGYSSNDFSPLPDMLRRKLKLREDAFLPATIKKLNLVVNLLTSPKHGTIKDLAPPGTEHVNHMPDGTRVILPPGTMVFHYAFVPNPGYRGKDYVEYEVIASGKSYKVVVNFLVLGHVNDNGPAQCSSKKFGR